MRMELETLLRAAHWRQCGDGVSLGAEASLRPTDRVAARGAQRSMRPAVPFLPAHSFSKSAPGESACLVTESYSISAFSSFALNNRQKSLNLLSGLLILEIPGFLRNVNRNKLRNICAQFPSVWRHRVEV